MGLFMRRLKNIMGMVKLKRRISQLTERLLKKEEQEQINMLIYICLLKEIFIRRLLNRK